MGNLFVEDSEILVTKSPFSAYEGEVKKYDGRQSPISLDHIMIKVKKEDVYGIDFDILEAIYSLEYSTSRMITQYLNIKGIRAEQSKIQNRLNYLNKLSVISRYKVVNDETETNTRIYCLERVGKYLLLSRDIPCKWVATDSTKSLPMMKRILARNQVLITYLSRLENIDSYNVNLHIKTKSNVFNPDLQIVLKNKEGAAESFLFITSRSYEGELEGTIEQIKLYEEYAANFVPNPPNMLLPSKLVVVGEDDKHLFEIFKQVLTNKISTNDLFFTSDLRVVGGELNRSIIQFALIKENDRIKPIIKEKNFELLK